MAVAAADAPAHRAVGPPGEESPAAVAPPTEADARALPDWLDRVDCRVRQTALLLPPHELPPYLERLARFYGYDTS